MANYNSTAIVLAKTKLGESDLILTLLAEDGSQIRAVAKGARKPTGRLCGVVELFSEIDAMFARGKNLDIVAEAKVIDSHEGCRVDLERSVAASVICEMLAKLSLEGQEQPQLFRMTSATLTATEKAGPECMVLIAAADMIKTLSLLGYRPELSVCISCGTVVSERADGTIAFSREGGGVVCDTCEASIPDTIQMDANLIAWLRGLIYSTFAEIEAMVVDKDTQAVLMRFCEAWLLQNTGVHLKSLRLLWQI